MALGEGAEAAGPDGPRTAAADGARVPQRGEARGQGLTLVHLSAQRKHMIRWVHDVPPVY